MLPFLITLVAGESPYRQIVYAATRAIVAGTLAPGVSFPSVRELSMALKINPNTAHKVIAELVRDGLLEVQSGVGTVVTHGRTASEAERQAMLARPVEQVVVEAKRLGLTLDEVQDAMHRAWRDLSPGSDCE